MLAWSESVFAMHVEETRERDHNLTLAWSESVFVNHGEETTVP